jgi:hypothetical protein
VSVFEYVNKPKFIMTKSVICLVFILFFTITVCATNLGSNPALSYDLAALPSDQKKSICDKNIAFCTNTCVRGLLKNTCDPQTMSFECQCVGDLPVSKMYFPINAQQCVGETQDCRNSCFFEFTSDTDKVTTCSNTCDAEFSCGTKQSKQSKQFYVEKKEEKTTTSPVSTSQREVETGAPVSTSHGHDLSSYIPFLLILLVSPLCHVFLM